MPLSPQNERAGGYFMFQANMLRPCLLGARGSAAGRRGHGLSSSFSVSANRTPRMLSTLVRSEEHTSELQSHLNLVCRLLLEKKKKPTLQCPSTQRPSPAAAGRHSAPRRAAR